MSSIDDPPYAPPAVLPFPVGTSPFRQKGNGYIGDRKFLEDVVPGGYERVIEALPDDALKKFFRQSFRPSEWYDAYPGSQLELTAAKLRGLRFRDHRRQTGAWHAGVATRGIYGALLRVLSNESVALWAPRISAIYFEFGKTETRAVGSREVSGVRRGVPAELAQWVLYASAGFCQGALEAAGAKDARMDIGDVSPDGHSHGRDLVKAELRITWR